MGFEARSADFNRGLHDLDTSLDRLEMLAVRLDCCLGHQDEALDFTLLLRAVDALLGDDLAHLLMVLLVLLGLSDGLVKLDLIVGGSPDTVLQSLGVAFLGTLELLDAPVQLLQHLPLNCVN